MKTELAQNQEEMAQLPDAELYSRSHSYFMAGTPLEKVLSVY
jgi:hypothetical protein